MRATSQPREFRLGWQVVILLLLLLLRTQTLRRAPSEMKVHPRRARQWVHICPYICDVKFNM